jgi:ComEC/Rec2-related protein
MNSQLSLLLVPAFLPMAFLIAGILLAFFSVHWFISNILLVIAIYCLLGESENPGRLMLLSCCSIWGFLSFQTNNNAFCLAKQKLVRSEPITGWVSSLEPSSTKQYPWRMQIYLTDPLLNGYYIDLFLRQKPNAWVNDKVAITLPKSRQKREKEDLFLFLRKEKIIETIFAHSVYPKILYRPTISISRRCTSIKNRILFCLKKNIAPITEKLINAMVLGRKPVRDEEWFFIQDSMQKWGIIHYLARSGLHVTLIIILIFSVFRWIPLPLSFKKLAAIALLAFFTLLTWMSVSFQRAVSTFSLGVLAQCFYQPTQSMQLLCISAIITCLLNPWQIFFLDFQLSFLMTGFLILFFDHKNEHHKNPRLLKAQ